MKQRVRGELRVAKSMIPIIRTRNYKWLLETVGIAKVLSKTYNSGYSLVVTHLTTNPPVRCLNRAERTGSLVFNVLWSYVKVRSIL
jgi:hypothetical protein